MLRRIGSEYVWPDRWWLAFGSGALVVSAFSNAYAPKAMGRLIDALSRRNEQQQCAGDSVRRELLVTALVFGVGAIASGLRVELFARVLERSVNRLRLEVYRAALSRRSAFFDETVAATERKPSDLAIIAERETRIACGVLTEQSQNAVRFVSSVLNGAVALAGLNARLAFELLCGVPVAAIFLKRAAKAVSRRQALAADAEMRCATRCRECLTSMRFVRAAAAEGYEFKMYAQLCAESERLGGAHGAARGAFHGLLDAVAKSSVLAIVARGGYFVQTGAMTPGQLVSFGLYATYFCLGLGGLAKFAASELSAGKRAAKLCLDVLHELDTDGGQDRGAMALLSPSDMAPALKAALPVTHNAEYHIELENVCFSYYNAQRPALNGASLRVRHGEIHGLVGRTGAGKTSTFGIILGLYDVDSGSVRINGHDLTTLTPAQLANLRAIEFATAEQRGSVIFRGSIADAINYPPMHEQAGSEAVQEAAILAEVHEWASDLGYDADLGAAGAAASGGQRARIALARALHRPNAKCLLLDEPTAAVDHATEERVLNNIINHAKSHRLTVLLIAHSRAAMARCDTLSVLADGKVVESGSFATLSNNSDSHLSYILRRNEDSGANSSNSDEVVVINS